MIQQEGTRDAEETVRKEHRTLLSPCNIAEGDTSHLNNGGTGTCFTNNKSQQ